MKTQFQRPLLRSGLASPRRPRVGWFLRRTCIALTWLGLVVAPSLRAQDVGLFSFDAQGTNATGFYPLAVLCLGPSQPLPPSTLYGTASLGGNGSEGTVFAINTDGTGFRVLHNFTNLDGAFPTAGLILSGDTLYGTTVNGGGSDNGTVFAVNTSGTGFRVLHNFTARKPPYYTNSDGGNPYAALILSGDTLYGTAQGGGNANSGTVFALNTNSTGFTVLHSFAATEYDSDFNLTNSDGSYPRGRLIASGNMLYGTASGGGDGGAGTVFAVSTNGASFDVLHSFAPVNPSTFTNSDGVSPSAGLILSGATLYGTTFQGGSASSGTVFAVNTNGTGFTSLYNFSGDSDGGRPASELVLLTNTLIGTASASGNPGSEGTVFAVNTDGTGFTVMHSFSTVSYDSNSNPTNSDGANSEAGLVFSGGALYGTAMSGGTWGSGTVFSLSLQPVAQLTILGATLSGTNLVIHGANGQSGGTYVTLMSPDVTLPFSKWTPAATNILDAAGNFSFTATNVVDAKVPQRFYILRAQ